MSKEILLVSTNVEDQAFIHEVASSIGYSVISTSAEDALPRALKQTPPIIFVDISDDAKYQEFSRVFDSQIGEGVGKISSNAIHFISAESLEKQDVLHSSDRFGHFIVRKYGDVKAAGSYYGRIVEGLCIRGDGTALDLDSIDPSKTKTITLKHSSEKKEAIDEILLFLQTHTQFSERVIPIIVNAVDELLMNAIYDAPTDGKGEQKLKSSPRDTPIELSGKAIVDLKMGFDGEYAGFTVIDRYGSVDKTKLIKHLLHAYSNDVYEVDQSVAGAGLGLATTFKTGGSLVFVKEPGARTEVTVFFRQTPNFREFRNQFRFVSIHVMPKKRAS